MAPSVTVKVAMVQVRPHVVAQGEARREGARAHVEPTRGKGCDLVSVRVRVRVRVGVGVGARARPQPGPRAR